MDGIGLLDQRLFAFHHRDPGVPKFVPTSKPDELRSIATQLGVSPRGIATYRNLRCPPRKCRNSFVFCRLGI